MEEMVEKEEEKEKEEEEEKVTPGVTWTHNKHNDVETLSQLVAVGLWWVQRRGIKNFSLYSVHQVEPGDTNVVCLDVKHQSGVVLYLNKKS